MKTHHIVRIAAFWIAVLSFVSRLLVEGWATQARYVTWAALSVWVLSMAMEKLSARGTAKRV